LTVQIDVVKRALGKSCNPAGALQRLSEQAEFVHLFLLLKEQAQALAEIVRWRHARLAHIAEVLVLVELRDEMDRWIRHVQ
jgi:hypothetical protein